MASEGAPPGDISKIPRSVDRYAQQSYQRYGPRTRRYRWGETARLIPSVAAHPRPRPG